MRTNGESSYTTLAPLQALLPTPYAMFANTASNLSGTLPAGQLAGAVPLANIPAAVLTNDEPSVSFGSVGIGTNNPTETLEINGTTRLDNYDIFFRSPGDYNHGLGYRNIIAGTKVNGPFLYGWSGGALGTPFPDAVALRWDWTGSAYVNNNLSVNAGLDINQTGQNIGNVQSNAVVFGAAYGHTGEGIASNRGGNTDDFEFFTNWENRMTIAHDGNVGIGTTAPQQLLSLNGGLNLDQASQNYGTVANALTFGSTSGEGIGSDRTGTNVDSYGLNFYTDYAKRMTIAQDGNVGIGTTTPSLPLEINGDSRIDDYAIYFRAGTDMHHALGYRHTIAGTTVDGPFLYGWSGGALGTPSPDLVALRWDRTGSVTVNSNLSIGAALVVPGAGVNTKTTAFVHRVTAFSINAGGARYQSQIDNPVCNGQPNAILIITHNWSQDTSGYDFTHPLGVAYGGSSDPHWYIYDETVTDLVVGQAFNVLVILPQVP